MSKRISHPWRQIKEIKYETVPCKTFNEFCKINNINDISLLCIDTEGLDDEILMSINFDHIHIDKIIWENWDHDDDDENRIYRTGTEIQKETKNKLESYKYKIDNFNESNLEATLNKNV